MHLLLSQNAYNTVVLCVLSTRCFALHVSSYSTVLLVTADVRCRTKKENEDKFQLKTEMKH